MYVYVYIYIYMSCIIYIFHVCMYVYIYIYHVYIYISLKAAYVDQCLEDRLMQTRHIFLFNTFSKDVKLEHCF